MTKKIPEPSRRSLLLDLLKGATDFLEEITDALQGSSERDRRFAEVEAEVSAAQEDVEAVKAEIDGLQATVEAIEKRQVTDTQTILETLQKLQYTQVLILERVKILEEAGRVEEATRWKALLARVAKLILLLVGPVALAEALRDAFVQEELYPWLKRLRQQAKDVLDPSESSPPAPTPTAEPTPFPSTRQVLASNRGSLLGQGQDGWSFLFEQGRNSGDFVPFSDRRSYNGSDCYTSPLEDYVRLCADGELHPGHLSRVAIRWDSNYHGTATISVHAHKIDTRCGDGIWIGTFAGGTRQEPRKLGEFSIAGSDNRGRTMEYDVQLSTASYVLVMIDIRGNSTCDLSRVYVDVYRI